MHGFKADKGPRRDPHAGTIVEVLWYVRYRDGRRRCLLGPFKGGRGRRSEGHVRAVEAARDLRLAGFSPRVIWRFTEPLVRARSVLY